MYEAPIKKMKKIIICMLFAMVATSAFAQEKNKARFGLDVGNYLGVNFLINAQDNMNFGLRMGVAYAMRKNQNEKEKFDTAITNFSAIYNYYMRLENSSVAFVGGGLGRYGFSVLGCMRGHRVSDESGKFGGFITTGIETGKFRLALEYNLLPSSSVLIDNIDDKFKNNHLAITAGFFIGGGKWK